MFWQVIMSVIVRKKNCLYEHMCNSEVLPRLSCLSLQIQNHCEW
jgi:hypothetical protein